MGPLVLESSRTILGAPGFSFQHESQKVCRCILKVEEAQHWCSHCAHWQHGCCADERGVVRHNGGQVTVLVVGNRYDHVEGSAIEKSEVVLESVDVGQ